MEQHSKADENYYVEASKLLELAHRAYELFEISEATQKRELLSFLLQNCKMDGKKLIPSLKMPFDQILLANKTQNWLPLKDLFCNHKLEFDISLSDLKIAFDEIGLKQPKLALATI